MPRDRFIKSVSAEVDVDIYASDLDDDTLLELCQERGISVGEDTSEEITEMFYAFMLGREDRAMELARQIAQNHTGRILS